jgi:hypothetical protein
MPWTEYPPASPPPIKRTKDGRPWAHWRKTLPDTPEVERRRAWFRAYHYHPRRRGKRRQYARTYQERHRGRLRAQADALRYRVLAHYSGGTPTCVCCGERGIWFLSLDHIHNNGRAERRQCGGTLAVYRALVQQGYPPGVRVLCYNCNLGRHFSPDPEKRCPHELVHDQLG